MNSGRRCERNLREGRGVRCQEEGEDSMDPERRGMNRVDTEEEVEQLEMGRERGINVRKGSNREMVAQNSLIRDKTENSLIRVKNDNTQKKTNPSLRVILTTDSGKRVVFWIMMSKRANETLK